MAEEVLVRKADGNLVPFDEAKLRASLQRADAAPHVVDQIAASIAKQLTHGMSTRTIYREAFKQLRSTSRHAAGRYRLKRALFELGPSGFPFEHFVAKLLETQGYSTTVGVIKHGRCVQHEVDVWAKNEHALRIIECKFHSDAKRKSAIQTALYVQARFQDLVAGLPPSEQPLQPEAGIVTNTRFTSEAVAYGACTGMQLIGWDQPHRHGLKHWIDASGRHPITCMSSLNKMEKRALLDRGQVMCCDLTLDILADAGVPEKKRRKVLSECTSIVEERSAP